jgi:lipopolysaccharide transport system permease protein
MTHPHPTPSPLRRYRSLILYKAYSDLRTEVERTRLGMVWWILEPIASMVVYYLVFSVILKRGTENYVAFLLAGVVPWRWFQAAVMHGSNSVVAAKRLIQQVHLPKVILPMVAFLTDLFRFCLVFVLLVSFLALFGAPFGWSYLWLPLVLLAQGLFIAGLSFLTAAVTPFFPDLRIGLQNILRLLFFLSGVFYDLNMFSETAQFYVRLNPMAVILESYRKVMLHDVQPDALRLALILVGSAAILAGAVALLTRFDHEYPKLKF